MNTTRHSFSDIFCTTVTDGTEAVKLQKIVIPIIQRDYAQGRQEPEIVRVRNRFLDSLYHAIIGEPITLDFIYGDIDQNGVMTPLDGQQRLTTLFLLYWYASRKDHVPDNECGFLNNFGYETRYSARDFCKRLVEFRPSSVESLSEEIIDQSWFPLDWKKDPTISSMLVMLDAIANKFALIDHIWERLQAGAITFYFLPIKEMGLTDELYIKMNSRGKPLSSFEHFKAELERSLRGIDEKISNRILYKIDREWTELLWQYRKSYGANKNTIDDSFIKYFRFICDILCYKHGESPQGKSQDIFDLLQAYFSSEAQAVYDNINTFESFFDCWIKIDGYCSPAAFLKSVLSHNHEDGKIVLFDRSNDSVDIFESCLRDYSDKNNRTRLFPLNRIALLYAIVCYLRNQSVISRTDFIRRIRIINNLIQNSEDELSDRLDRNRIPAILCQIDSIMLNGEIDESIEASFNSNQLAEEKAKIAFLDIHPEKAKKMFLLEDHVRLKGQISIVGIENIDYAERFCSLFSCNYDKIDCAMMSIGDYYQQERKRTRFQFASSSMQFAWDALFHKSANLGFKKTSAILINLLSRSETFSNNTLQNIIDDYIQTCEAEHVFPLRYYYVKYKSFRPGSYGKFFNDDVNRNQYLFTVMQTQYQLSSNSYSPFLHAADKDHLDRDSYGRRLIYNTSYLECRDSAIVVIDRISGQRETIKIDQNVNGVDCENRIIKLRQLIVQRGAK